MPDSVSFNEAMLRRLTEAADILGNILVSLSDVADRETYESRLNEYVDYTQSTGFHVIEKDAKDCAILCRKTEDVASGIHILARSIKASLKYLDFRKATFGQLPSTTKISAGSFSFDEGDFFFNDEVLMIGGQPAKLLLEFIKADNHFLRDSQIEDFFNNDEAYLRDPSGPARRINRLKDALSSAHISRDYIVRDSIRSGYRLLEKLPK